MYVCVIRLLNIYEYSQRRGCRNLDQEIKVFGRDQQCTSAEIHEPNLRPLLITTTSKDADYDNNKQPNFSSVFFPFLPTRSSEYFIQIP